MSGETAADVVRFPEIQATPFVARDAAEPTTTDSPTAELEPVTPVGDLVEWTPERGAALARAFGLAVHTVDPAAHLPGGDALWRATEAEAQEIGAPLARILARYEPTRRLAGVVDEAELGAAFVSYTKRNMRDRGRLLLAARDLGDGEGFAGGEAD